MNICKFNTAAPSPDTLYTLNFVYETEERNMQSLRTDLAHKAHLVTEGEGILHTVYHDVPLHVGDVFFTFAATPYSVESMTGLKYMYIGFLGIRANMLFERLKISKKNCVIPHCEEIRDMWKELLKQSDNQTIDLIAEAALLYAFAVIEKKSATADFSGKSKERILLIKKYIDENCYDVDFSIDKIANRFSYGKKYISEILKKEFGLSVQQYVSLLRIQNACSLIDKNITCVSDIAKLCGFSDPLYFSKVFKKKTGVSPKDYIRQRREKTALELMEPHPEEAADILR